MLPLCRYRPPELELRSTSYGQSADIWSVGCVLGEIADGESVFSGETALDQLHQIQSLLGPFEDMYLPGATRGICIHGGVTNLNTNSKQYAKAAEKNGIAKRYAKKLDKHGIDFLQRT